MCSLMASLLLPANLKPDFSDKERSSSIPSTTRSSKRKKQSMFPVKNLNLLPEKCFQNSVS